MAQGFFEMSEVLQKAPISDIPKCGACGLFKLCKSPKMPVSGEGKKKILIVGEAPGADEDDEGKQFVGKTGRLLRDTLRSLGVEMRKDCWVTNAVICRPPKNETPDGNKIDYCRPNLISTVKSLDPVVIIPLGNVAIQSLLKWIWKDDVDNISTFSGFTIPCQRPNLWVCPTFHPSYVSRLDKEENKRRERDMVARMWTDHLRTACQKTKRPWKNVPDYKSKVEIILDEDQAVDAIEQYRRAGQTIAFDYECNMLKPDDKGAGILSCAISDGVRTVAFPWTGRKLQQAMGALLRSKCRKIAANMKFEERWTKRVFGHGVTNWFFDTMVAAHWIDSRPNITSLKFQSFVLLGMESYEGQVKPLMRAKKGERTNRLDSEVSISKLLLYNGLDALLEFKVAMKMIHVTGFKS